MELTELKYYLKFLSSPQLMHDQISHLRAAIHYIKRLPEHGLGPYSEKFIKDKFNVEIKEKKDLAIQLQEIFDAVNKLLWSN